MPNPLDTADLRRRVQDCLDHELAHQAQVVAELGPDVDDLLRAVTDLLRGGKRLRAAFLYWGHRAAGRPDSQALVRLASAMELFQAAALIHDDEFDAVASRLPDSLTVVRESDWVAELAATARPRPLSRPERGGRTIILTSGTTGTPKGAARRTPGGFGPLISIIERIPPGMMSAPATLPALSLRYSAAIGRPATVGVAFALPIAMTCSWAR